MTISVPIFGFDFHSNVRMHRRAIFKILKNFAVLGFLNLANQNKLHTDVLLHTSCIAFKKTGRTILTCNSSYINTAVIDYQLYIISHIVFYTIYLYIKRPHSIKLPTTKTTERPYRQSR